MTNTSPPIRVLQELIVNMRPILHEGVYVFVSIQDEHSLDSVEIISSMREREGFSAVIREEDALRLGLEPFFRSVWITLEVHSDLEATGFTAAFSTALAAQGIGCNVVAGAYHDHLFVPVEQADAAMQVLTQLQIQQNTS